MDLLGQLVQPVLHGDEPTSASEFSDSASEFLVCFVRPEDANSLEGEAKKDDAVGSCYRTLGFIDRELEFVRQEVADALHDPFAGTLTLHQYDEVVSVTDEAVATLLKLFVQVVEEDVGQKRRKRTALRYSQAGLFQPSVNFNPSPQVLADQGQYPFVAPREAGYGRGTVRC